MSYVDRSEERLKYWESKPHFDKLYDTLNERVLLMIENYGNRYYKKVSIETCFDYISYIKKTHKQSCREYLARKKDFIPEEFLFITRNWETFTLRDVMLSIDQVNKEIEGYTITLIDQHITIEKNE